MGEGDQAITLSLCLYRLQSPCWIIHKKPNILKRIHLCRPSLTSCFFKKTSETNYSGPFVVHVYRLLLCHVNEGSVRLVESSFAVGCRRARNPLWINRPKSLAVWDGSGCNHLLCVCWQASGKSSSTRSEGMMWEVELFHEVNQMLVKKQQSTRSIWCRPTA